MRNAGIGWAASRRTILICAMLALAACYAPRAASGRTWAVASRAGFVDGAGAGAATPLVVWYPTDRAGASRYLPGEEAQRTVDSLARNLQLPVDALTPLTRASMPIALDAEPAHARFPLVVLSHGLITYPRQNTLLAMRLASRGYVVVSVAHPGDAVDLRLGDGSLVPTEPMRNPDPRFPQRIGTLTTGADHATRTGALKDYAGILPDTRLGRSMQLWGETIVRTVRLFDKRASVPAWLRPVVAVTDRRRVAFVGMSLGGEVSAATCRRVVACVAAVNLDGQNFDPTLFDAAVGRPLLLVQSDWTRYELFPGQPLDPGFSPDDYAYEPWRTSGTDPSVVRVRVDGIRHMGFTDLVALATGPNRDAIVGSIDGARATALVNDLTLAFLDRWVKRAPDRLSAVLARYPEAHRRTPDDLRRWAQSQRR